MCDCRDLSWFENECLRQIAEHHRSTALKQNINRENVYMYAFMSGRKISIH